MMESAIMVWEVNPETDDNSHQVLSKCIVGTFNDPFNDSRNQEVIKSGFRTDVKSALVWKSLLSLKTNLLIELPSSQEMLRVHTDDWFWNGWHLALEW